MLSLSSLSHALPWLALLGQVFSSLVSMVCYLSGGPLDDLFQLRFQTLHYGFNGLWDFLQLRQSLKEKDNMNIVTEAITLRGQWNNSPEDTGECNNIKMLKLTINRVCSTR